MNPRALLFGLLLLTACHTTSKLRQNDLALLNGKWELACSGSINQPDNLDCPDIKGSQQISCDLENGYGKFHYQLPDGKLDVNFKLVHETNKWYVVYLDGSGNTSRGEIVRLNRKELVLHYADVGTMTVQRRVE